MADSESITLTFRQAAEEWLRSRTGQISPRTVKDYRAWLRILNRTFGDMLLTEIQIAHVEAYQQERKAGPICINHELNTLSQILARAGLWEAIKVHYRPMKVSPSSRGRALSADEEERLFKFAAANPRWKIAYCCAIISTNTTAGPGEIRNLRLRDIVTTGEYPHISITQGIKNQYRERGLPLNAAALWAVEQLIERAHEKGAGQPSHYLLPHRANGNGVPDPTRPMGSWRKAWDKLREAAGLPTLRMYDLRHHAITRLLENENISEREAIELAGHVNRKMLDNYSHIRRARKMAAVRAVESVLPGVSPSLQQRGKLPAGAETLGTVAFFLAPRSPRNAS